ncbi:MAG TPA: type VI secretion system-associated FHA domain protein TagH [Steroidobacteraceae bacterium]|nr:type VI secretion system-associated FHA domain protein TagH [Steroidobacteraceae bacterium]
MTLRLRVVSDHRRLLGDRSTMVFGFDGGTLGRSADNDWVLPDPLRYVSAHHGRVQYRDGQFFLEDLSTNGIFLNDEELPVSKRFPGGYRMQNGDIIRVGEYHIVVAVEASEATAAPAPSEAPAVPTSIHALHTLGRAAQTDIGAMLNLDELLLPDASPSDNFRPVDAYGVPVRSAASAASPAAARGAATPAVAQAVAAEPAGAPDIDLESEAVARRIARLARAAGRDPRNGASAPALYDVQTGLQAFCRGAGVDGDKLSPDAQTRMLHLAGQLFREALVGFKELERARHEVRNRFRVELTQPEPDDPRPSLARLTVDELMLELLQQHESRRLDAVQWLREAVAEAKTHENASSAAMRAAFIEFLDRLDPSELEARFERAARRGKAKSADKAQYWELFTTFYRNLIEMPADHLPHTFIEAFATAYRDFFKQTPPQR